MGLAGLLWRTTVEYFRDYSSIPGLSNAAKYQRIPRIAYWLIITIVGFYLTMDQVMSIMNDYNSFPVTTSTELVPSKSVFFPAVTVCNLNRINCHSLYSAMVEQYNAEDSSENNTVVKTLEALFEMTGCNDQICSSLNLAIHDLRVDTKEDKAVLNLAYLSCIKLTGDPFENYVLKKACYHLAGMKIDSKVDDLTKEDAQWAYDSFQCSEALACAHKPTDQKQLANFYTYYYLPFCDSVDYGSTTTTSGTQPPGNSAGTNPATTQAAAGGATTQASATEAPTATTAKKRRRRKRQVTTTTESTSTTADSSSSYDTYNGYSNYDNFDYEVQYFDVSEEFTKDDEFFKDFMSLSIDMRMKIGHLFSLKEDWVLGNLTGMIRGCTYAGGDCNNETLWAKSNVPGFGNCFTFNSGIGDRNVTSTTLTGNKNGLSVEMFIDQDNYMLKKFSKKAGIRLVVHHPLSIPLADEYGMDLHPNTASSVAVQMNDIQRMPAPYTTNCTNVWTDQDFNQSWYVDNPPDYSVATCQRHCIQVDIIKSCGCFHINMDLDLINITRAEFTNGSRSCSIIPKADNKDYKCFKPIMAMYAAGLKNCLCNLACRETSYATSLSSSVWPSDQYWQDLAIEFGFTEDLKTDEGKVRTQAKIQKDNLKVDVYFQSLNVRVINQTATYTSDSLFSAIGGALGFYTGIALIMIFEVFELLWELFEVVWQHHVKSRRLKKSTDVQND